MARKRKTTIGIVGAASACLLFAALLFYFTAARTVPSRLVFVEIAWGEYGVDEKPAREIEVEKGCIIHSSIKGFEEIAFKIEEVFSDSVVIKTNRPMSLRRSEDGRINLDAEETEFILKKDSAIFLDTPTMDAGAAYKIVLK